MVHFPKTGYGTFTYGTFTARNTCISRRFKWKLKAKTNAEKEAKWTGHVLYRHHWTLATSDGLVCGEPHWKNWLKALAVAFLKLHCLKYALKTTPVLRAQRLYLGLCQTYRLLPSSFFDLSLCSRKSSCLVMSSAFSTSLGLTTILGVRMSFVIVSSFSTSMLASTSRRSDRNCIIWRLLLSCSCLHVMMKCSVVSGPSWQRTQASWRFLPAYDAPLSG